VDLFARTYPLEAALVRALLRVLVADHGHSELDWALLLRRNPDRFMLALRKANFCRYWLAYAKKDPEIEALLRAAGNLKRHVLTTAIREESFSPDTPLGRLTVKASMAYLQSQETT
jgi:hypothetical protein